MQTKNDFCIDGHCCTGDCHAPVLTVKSLEYYQ